MFTLAYVFYCYFIKESVVDSLRSARANGRRAEVLVSTVASL